MTQCTSYWQAKNCTKLKSFERANRRYTCYVTTLKCPLKCLSLKGYQVSLHTSHMTHQAVSLVLVAHEVATGVGVFLIPLPSPLDEMPVRGRVAHSIEFTL